MITEQPTQRASTSSLDRRRIAVIGVVAALAVVIGLVLGSFLVARGAGLARAADYVPRSAVMYFEMNLDLPGAQRDNLRAILDRFPAIQADDILSDALAQTLDDALAQGNAPFDYSNDIAPWFDGSVAAALLDVPTSTDPTQVQMPGMLALFGVRDAAAASDLADTIRGALEADGSTFTSGDHDGVTVWSLDVDTSGMAGTLVTESQGMMSTETMVPMAGMGFAYAVTDDQLILGTGRSVVERALDAHAGSGDRLADDSDVADLLASLPDERVGVTVVNTAAMLEPMRAALASAEPALADALAPYLDATPPVSVGALTLSTDAITGTMVSDVPGGAAAPENASRDLAEMVPAGAILFADTGKVGASLDSAIAAMKAALAAGPNGDQQLAALDQVEAALGADLEELVSWIGSGGFAVGWDGELVYAGAVLEAVDPAAAARRLSQLGALAELAASDPSSGITVSTDTVAGVEVTTIRLAYSGAPAFDVPFAPAIQYAIDGDRVLIGFGDRFVGNALTMDPAASLAASDRYGAAIDRFGGPDNAGSFFLDLTALREAVETGMSVDQQPAYGLVRPNLEPFDYLVSVTRVDGGGVSAKLGLVLR